MRQALLIAAAAALLVSCKKDDDTPASPTVTGTPCTYAVGNWSAWNLGVRTRTVDASPAGCVGTMPATSENHACVAANKGFIRVVNNSSNPYEVTITGPTGVDPFVLPGGYMADSIYVGIGTYGLYSIQQSGFVVFPSEYNGTINLARCATPSWQFP